MPDGLTPISHVAKLALLYLNAGHTDVAGEYCDRILSVQPAHPQALLLKLWVARRKGDMAAMVDAGNRLLSTPQAFATVPLFPEIQPGPHLAEPTLARIFGGDHPPVTDISDHLPTLYFEALTAAPKFIVELGTRGGESTRTLLAAALRMGSRMLSLDIDPCDIKDLPEDARKLWRFVQHDDVDFGLNKFASWCKAEKIDAKIDLLFIDTSHLYEHTKEELKVWMPLVAPKGTVIFHDTNMGVAYSRNDSSIGIGWDNDRGVIRAIEEYLGRHWDENSYFVDVVDDWVVRHDPKSSGFTILRRLK